MHCAHSFSRNARWIDHLGDEPGKTLLLIPHIWNKGSVLFEF